MSGLLPFDPALRRRDTAPGTSLGAIADGLARELAPWLDTPLPIPDTKARLTRIGGRCAEHGVLLEFDPRSPWVHRCPRCGQAHEGQVHHEWWAMGAHLFTAERAVHAAALHLLRGDEAHRDLAVRTLQSLAERYASWPNRDNVLGPTRPFFSTYLESIWLLNLCHALALLEQAGVHHISATVRERLLEPSSALIASYHEGRSNRQVWNEVAILSAWTLLGRHPQVQQRLDAPGSLPSLLEEGLLPDGTWYEGENYHQFAHRGLWYGVHLLDVIGRPVAASLRARFLEGFAAPFAGLLPDETLPARRDAQYAVSIRQWRWAEWCELGYALSADARLAAVLRRLYDGSAPAGETGRAVSTADAERNRPAVSLTRADCSWRALLMATADPVTSGTWAAGSLVQPRQGLAVLRREQGQVYVALEGGVSGGGHGHPDRLALTLQRGPDRCLDDPGTGSYVERTLHWYRSTLAHHAPLVNGASQQRGYTALTAFEDRGGAGWVQKVATDLAPGVTATRSVVVCDGYLVDLLDWTAAEPVTVTLPVATGQPVNLAAWRPGQRIGAGGLEDGFEFLTQVEEAVDVPPMIDLEAPAGHVGTAAGTRWRGWYAVSGEGRWWRATAPGAPGREAQSRLFVDVHGTGGRIVGIWSWRAPGDEAAVTEVRLSPEAAVPVSVTTSDGTTATHEPAPHGWHIGLVARHSRSSIDLEFLAEPPAISTADAAPARTAAGRVLHVPRVASLAEVTANGLPMRLAAPQYVPTEEPWGDANAPEAQVWFARVEDDLVVHVVVCTGHPPVVPVGGTRLVMPENPLDNERADVNADGLQCYIGAVGDPVGTWRAAVLAVPCAPRDVRVTSLVPGGPVPTVDGAVAEDGWHMQLRWPLSRFSAEALTIDLVVNERPPDRERRRGQLVLSGGGGFGYLRGDRHAPPAPPTLRLG